jgi:hypothetical protein
MKMKNLTLLLVSFFYLSQINAQYNLVLNNKDTNPILFSIDIKKTKGAEQIIISRGDRLEEKHSSGLLYGDYSRTFFETAVQTTIINFSDFTSVEVSYLEAKRAIEVVYEKVLLTRLPLNTLNEERGAGIIKILNREIKLANGRPKYNKSKKNKDTTSRKNTLPIEVLQELETLRKFKEWHHEEYEQEHPMNRESSPRSEFNANSVNEKWEIDSSLRLVIEQVSFEISDNFITRITIDGIVTDGITSEEVSIDNTIWSLALKKFDHQTNSVSFKDSMYSFSYGAVFLYKATATGSKGYHIQDAEFTLKPFQEKTLLKRGLDQYLGINIFSDYFGLYAPNPNSPLSMSFSANIPLNLYQKRNQRFFQQANVTINTAILNNFGGIGGFGNIIKHEPIIDTSNKSPIVDTFMLDHFDLIRFKNFSVSGYFTTIGLEAKKLNTTFHIGLGAELYVSRFKYTEATDSIDISNEYSIVSAAPFINFIAEYRPDQFFGINMEARVKYLTMLTSSNAIPQLLESAGLYEKNVLNKKGYNEMTFINRLVFTAEMDLFAHINNKGKSGIFARVGGELSINNANIFPMIVLGYSTNLDSYINSIREE